MRSTATSFLAFLIFSFLSLGVKANLPDFTKLVEKTSPAVVKINTVTRSKTAQAQPDLQQIPEIFRPFFSPQQPQRNLQSMGSGFVISKDGYIVTNNHVIDGADEVVVRMTDRTEYNAKVIGADKSSDLALLKIEGKNLPYLSFGNSENLKIGEWVLAIGSPFGLDFSVSAGIVSAKGRSIPTKEGTNYVPFIQSDVAINPGNSGGPLFGLDGSVVGVNSQIVTNSGGSIGLSFAIPASTAKNVIAQLKDKGRVDRGWLGVMIDDVDKDLASAFGLKKPRGALIAQVVENGPADKAGIKSGDIVLEFNGIGIDSAGELPHVVGVTAPSSKVDVVIMREKKRKELKVTIQTLGGDKYVSDAGSTASFGGRLGLVVEALTSENKTKYRDGGVVVTQVMNDGPADKTGIRVGDVITQLGFEQVKSVKDFNRIAKRLPKGRQLPVRFFRNDRPVFRSLLVEK